MIKKYKKVFLTAFALTCILGLTYSINLKYNSIANKDKVLARESTPDKGDGGATQNAVKISGVNYCKAVNESGADSWDDYNKIANTPQYTGSGENKTFIANCTGAGKAKIQCVSNGSLVYNDYITCGACYSCGGKYSWYDGNALVPNNCTVVSATNSGACQLLNTENSSCRRCSNSQAPGGFEYKWTTQESGCGSPVAGITNATQCKNLNNTSVSTLRDPKSDKTISIAESTEKEVTLDPPSRATNTVTGTCEDYIVTEENNDKTGIGVDLPIAKTNYLYYSAKTNCTDNQGQEFVAFCVDPAQWGPKPSDNYLIDTYIDPNDGDFSKGIVYIYKEFLKTGMSLVDRCAAENAIRYLEYDNYDLGGIAGGIATRLSGNFSADAEAYRRAVGGVNKSPLTGGSCAAQAWAWYQAAKTAIANNDPTISEGYGVANVEIVPDSDYTQDDSGNVSGHLLVQTPSGERVNGNITITCPSGVNCSDEGNGRIGISGTLGCGDNKLTAAVAGASSDSNIKSALLVVNKKDPSRKQRFVLFQTGGSVSMGASFEFDGVKNCSTCQTSVNFACVPEGSYTNPIKLKEGTVDGSGDTDWAACVYNNNDEKGNTFNAFKNDYCVVSCTEEWDFRLPGNIQTVSGRNFSFTAQLGAKRTCRAVGDNSGGGVVTPINYRRADGQNGQPSATNRTSFAKDHDFWLNKMVEAYNKYLKNYSAYRGLQNYVDTHLGGRTSLKDDVSNTCNQAEYPADWKIPANTNFFFETFPLDLTKSPFPYTQIYTYTSGSQVIGTATPTDTIITIESNKASGSKTEDYIGQTTCQQTMPSGVVRDVPCEKTCTKTRTKYYAKPGNEKYEEKIQEFLNNAQAAYNEYAEALSQIEKIYEMYKECTDWENKYTFDPEIRFTYQEESYMDLLLQHQNKNYLINRTELEESRTAKLTTYDIDIAVGEPGTNLEFLNSVGANGGGANESWGLPLDSIQCTQGAADPHRGIDLSISRGNAVKAVKSGVVTEAGYHYSWGNTVLIDHGNGWTSRYAHMDSLRVARGSIVNQGDIVGLSGNTGNVYGANGGYHLHLEIYHDGVKQDPAQLLGISCSSNGAQDTISPTGGNADYGDFVTHGEEYPYIKVSGFGNKGSIDKHTVTEATYGVSDVEYKAEETEYRSGVYFYTINPSGKVTTDKNEEGAVPLGYVYPVSLQTDQGDYPYYLNFGYVGMYNDSNRLGRIMGAAESSVLSGSAADYACKYNVCDPTMQDCPPQMCDVVTDGNGNTHYYDKEGNETDKDTHDKECSSRDKVCTREKDENGNDVFCDVNGNCSPDPSSYLKTCAKECAGYTLVGYNSYTGAEVDSSGRLQFLPKVVSLNNLFSSGDQSAKAINWQNSKAQAARNEIESNGEKIFANSQYEFNLSPSAMAEIRNYNKKQEDADKGYADFTLKCDDYGSDCVSSFLNNIGNMGVNVVKRDTSFTHDSKDYSYK